MTRSDDEDHPRTPRDVRDARARRARLRAGHERGDAALLQVARVRIEQARFARAKERETDAVAHVEVVAGDGERAVRELVEGALRRRAADRVRRGVAEDP